MLTKIHADYSVSITDLKRNPQALINDAGGEIIALLNRNKPTAYIVPAETYDRLMDLAEDIEIGRIIEDRKAEKADAVEISLDEL
ncbi:MAG: type II toxin-antitoxin system prevent-host-death family antitoxin [Pseudomonadota bacterium]